MCCVQLVAFVEFLLSKRVGVVDDDGKRIGPNCNPAQTALSQVGDALIVNVPDAGVGGVAEEDTTVIYHHEGSRAPDIVWCGFVAPISFLSSFADQPAVVRLRREHSSGFLRVDDAFGMAAKCHGMKLGLELRMVNGTRVGGVPQPLLKQIVATAPSPVAMVFIEPDGAQELQCI